ncbi:MAG: hypothetical protein IKY33_04190 [Clostridia bacterium]|nr:hypothetical protein [Clostridia bacterium]
MEKMLIGWAEESLVPNKKVSLEGQFYERISEYVETEVTATAMAVQYGEEKAIIISCDLTSITSALMKTVREKFAQMTTEIDPKYLIIGATHTHTSIGYRADLTGTVQLLNTFLPEDKKYTQLVQTDDSVISCEEALEFLSDRIAQAAYKAWMGKKEAMYTNAFGRAAIGFNRRVCYNDGSAQMWGDTNTAAFTALEGGNDSGIELLYVFDADKKLTGIVANIACPSQILEHRSFISADYWGEVKKLLRQKFGEDIYLLAMCGAGGDQCPRDLIRWQEPETPINDPNISRPNVLERTADPSMFDLSGCRLAGKRIAGEIISVYEEITDIKTDIPFEHKALVFDLPLRKATISDYQTAIREIEYYVDKNKNQEQFNFKDSAALYVYAGTIQRYHEQQTQEIMPTEVHILRFGDVAIATNPFELFLDYGNYIKARSFAKQTFIMQLTCDDLGYLPTENAEKGGHYSAYISSGSVGHQGGDMLVRRTITEINEMFK